MNGVVRDRFVFAELAHGAAAQDREATRAPSGVIATAAQAIGLTCKTFPTSHSSRAAGFDGHTYDISAPLRPRPLGDTATVTPALGNGKKNLESWMSRRSSNPPRLLLLL